MVAARSTLTEPTGRGPSGARAAVDLRGGARRVDQDAPGVHADAQGGDLLPARGVAALDRLGGPEGGGVARERDEAAVAEAADHAAVERGRQRAHMKPSPRRHGRGRELMLP